MNVRTTMLVVLLAIGLLGYVIVFETDLVFDRGATGDAAAPTTTDASGKPLLARGRLLPGQIESIRIDRPGELPFVAERNDEPGGGWRLAEPIRFALSERPLASLADAISTLHYTNRIDDADPERFGLADPTHRLTVIATEDQQTRRFTLALGRVSAAGRAYLQRDDDPAVYVVDDTLHQQLLGADLTAWRRTGLDRIEPATLREIALQRPDGAITLAQHDGRWAFQSGATGRAADSAAQELVNVVNLLTIEAFVRDHPADLEPFGLDEPRYALTLRGRPTDPNDPNTAATHRLRVGRSTDLADKNAYAMWDDAQTVFTIPVRQTQPLDKPVDELRDARITPVEPQDVRRVTVTDDPGDAPRLRLVFEDGRWRFDGMDPNDAVEPDQVRDLVRALTTTQATAFTPGRADHTFSTTARLVVEGRPDDEVLRIAPPSDDQPRFRVVRGEERVVYHVDADKLSAVMQSPVAFRDRTVLDIAPDAVAALAVQRTDPPADFELKRRQNADGNFGDWDLAGYDRDALQRLLDALHPLRATGWIEVHDMALLPDAIDLTMADGSTRTIRVDTDRLLGSADGVPGRFTLGPATVDALTDELRDRQVIDLELDDIASVTVGQVTIERDRDGVYRRGDDRPLDEQTVGALFDTLAGLHVRYYVPDDWAKIDADNPPHVLSIAPRDGRPLQLHLWPESQSDRDVPLGRVDHGRLFTLSARQFMNLTAVD